MGGRSKFWRKGEIFFSVLFGQDGRRRGGRFVLVVLDHQFHKLGVVFEEVLEDLDMTGDLFAGADFASFAKDVLGDEFVAAAGPSIDGDFAAADVGDTSEGVHKGGLDVVAPDGGSLCVVAFFFLAGQVTSVGFPVCDEG